MQETLTFLASSWAKEYSSLYNCISTSWTEPTLHLDQENLDSVLTDFERRAVTGICKHYVCVPAFHGD
jgi:hypothetical protein